MASFPGLPLPPPVRKAVVRAVAYYTSPSAPDIPTSFIPYLSATVPYITSLEVTSTTLPHTFSIVVTARTIIEHVNAWCTRQSISRAAYLAEAVRRRPDRFRHTALESSTTHAEPSTALEVFDPHADISRTLEVYDPHADTEIALETTDSHAERRISRLSTPTRQIDEIDHEGDLLFEKAHDGSTVTPLQVKPSESALVHTAAAGPSTVATKPKLGVSTGTPSIFQYRNPTVANESSDEAEADLESPEAPAYTTSWNITDLLAEKLGTATIVDSAAPAVDKEITMYNPATGEGALGRLGSYSDKSDNEPDTQPQIEDTKDQQKKLKGKEHRRDSREGGLLGGLFGRSKPPIGGPSARFSPKSQPAKPTGPDPESRGSIRPSSHVSHPFRTPKNDRASLDKYEPEGWQDQRFNPQGHSDHRPFEPEASSTPLRHHGQNFPSLQNPAGPRFDRDEPTPAEAHYAQQPVQYGLTSQTGQWDYQAQADMEARLEQRFERRLQAQMNVFTRNIQETLRQMTPITRTAPPPRTPAPPAPPPVVPPAAYRSNLKPDMVCYFEPKNMEDYRSACNFVDAIDTCVTFEGDAATAAVLQRCLKGECAVNWRSSLSDQDKYEMRIGTEAWKRCIIRDFYPRQGILLIKANREVFRWNQNRTPLEYVTEKLRLLRLAGIRDENQLVEEVHNGFAETPELFSSLENCIQETGNSVSKYRNDVSRHQEAAKATYALRGNRYQTAFQFKKPDPEKNTDTKSGSKSYFAKPDSSDAKTAKRSRPCRWCKGEHWDKECTRRPSASGTTPRVRGYYAHMGVPSSTESSEVVDIEDEDAEMEEEYERNQVAFFADAYLAIHGFMGRQASNKNIDAYICKSCDTKYPTRNKLYKHLKEKGHATPSDLPDTIIVSDVPRETNPTANLHDYHFAQVRWGLDSRNNDTFIGCADCGYGNSAIDSEFLKKQNGPKLERIPLTRPVEVTGIGGGIVLAQEAVMLPVHMKTMCGSVVTFTRPFHIFPNLGVPILMGNDIMYPEKMTVSYASGTPSLIVGSCRNKRVQLKVRQEPDEVKRVVARTTETVIIQPGTTMIVCYKTGKTLPKATYVMQPTRTRNASNGSGVPHTIINYDQTKIGFTNFDKQPLTLPKGTVIGIISTLKDTQPTAKWSEASHDATVGFFGLTKAMAFLAATNATAAGSVSHPTNAPTTSPGAATWQPPTWINDTYVPNYKHALPAGIKVPDVSTSTWAQVQVNDEDDITPDQTAALRNLAKRHMALFNDGKGSVREPEGDWLRIDIPPEVEVKVRSRAPYPLNKRARDVIYSDFDDHIETGRLEKVTRPTPHAMQVFVVYGKNGKERPVVDGRPLNELVPGDAYPVPRQEEVIAQVKGMRWLSTGDITSCFYQRILHPETRHRAAVVTHRGLEQWAVAMMGYKTSVQHQQRLMDKAFKDVAWRFVCCYVDDILIYSNSFDEHLLHLDEVFRILSDLGITLKAKKVFLGFHNVELLGYIVDRLGLTTTESKSASIANLQFPSTLAELEHFIGLTNWNRHLIPYYAQRIAPLQLFKTTALRGAPPSSRGRKSFAQKTPVPDEPILVEAFEDVRQTLADKPRLYHVRYDRPVYAFLDSSQEYGTGLAVYQEDDITPTAIEPDTSGHHEYRKTKLVPLHFLSKPLSTAERNYWPTDLEMSGLVWSVKKLRPYMDHVHVHFYTDHRPNVDIAKMTGLNTTSTARSSMRLQTWGIYLNNFNDKMTIHYEKGSDLGCPDALSRLQNRLSSTAQNLHDWAARLRGETEMTEFEVSEAFCGLTVPPEDDVPIETLATLTPDASLLEAISASTKASLRYKPIIDRLEKDGIAHEFGAPVPTSDMDSETDVINLTKSTDSCEFSLYDGRLYFNGGTEPRLLVPGKPEQLQLLKLSHDAQSHQGFLKTFLSLRRFAYWPGLSKSIVSYIYHCVPCQKNKPRRHKAFGNLRPIESPGIPFHTLHIDLITDLPEVLFRGVKVDSIMTATCRFSKARRFMPGRKDWTASRWAQAFDEGVTNNGWGYPAVLVTDRDKRFLGLFWKTLMTRAGTRNISTTAYHPAGDGLAERTNQELEIALRFNVDLNQEDWPDHLQIIQSQFNNSHSEPIGRTPNEVLYGFNVRTALELSLTPNANISLGGVRTVGTSAEAAIHYAELREAHRKEAIDAIKVSQKAMMRSHGKRHQKPDWSSGYAYINLNKHGFRLPSANKVKLTQQRVGPFEILGTYGRGNALRLKLPPTFRIHDVISIAHLEAAPKPDEDPFQRNSSPPPEPTVIDGVEEHEVERILRKKKHRGKTVYLVRWKGYDAEDDSWEPFENLGNAKELLDKFSQPR